jgi:ATP-dependent DNA helicase DinG
LLKGWVDDYCVLEIITTGPDPQTALPVEAAALRIVDGVEVDALTICMDPGVPIPASLLERSGRGEEEFRGALPPGIALSRIRDFLGGRATLAHDGTSMEAALLERFQVRPAGPILDTRELAWLVAPYMRDHSLPSLATSLLGEPLSWKSLEDTRLLLRILDGLEEAWRETPSLTREAVHGALSEVDSPWRFMLAGRRGRNSFPDLVELISRADADLRENGVEASSPEIVNPESSAPEPEQAVSILSPEGPLASLYPDHEVRPQQTAMARAAASAMGDAAFLAVEAGTGVGKSLAYLVPGVLHTRGGKGPLLVSTYTRNLQEQLFHRDLPLLSRCLGSFEFSLLKGRGNYLCLRKWSEWCQLLSEGDPVLHFSEIPPGLAYAFLAPWVSRSSSGDLEEVSINLRGLIPDLMADLASSPEDCLRSHCRLHSRCWVERARSRAARSQVVVINHALLLNQIQAAGTGAANLILPDYRLLVVDEAHHLEDVATEAFTHTFSLEECLKMLEEIAGRKGILPRWERLPLDGSGQKMVADAYREAEEAGREAELLFEDLIDPLLPSAPAGAAREEATRHRLNHQALSSPRWEDVRERGLDLAGKYSHLSILLANLAEKTLSLKERDDQEALKLDARRAEALSGKAAEASTALEVFARDPEDEGFRDVQPRRGTRPIRLRPEKRPGRCGRRAFLPALFPP